MKKKRIDSFRQIKEIDLKQLCHDFLGFVLKLVRNLPSLFYKFLKLDITTNLLLFLILLVIIFSAISICKTIEDCTRGIASDVSSVEYALNQIESKTSRFRY